MDINPSETALASLAEAISPPSIAGEAVPVGQPDSAVPDTEQTDVVITLSPRDLELSSAVPLVVRSDGIVWFDIGSGGLEIAATCDALAFTHRSNATVRGSSAHGHRGFGVPADELASVARWSLRQVPSVGLDLHYGTGGVFATPNPLSLTNGVPFQACLIGIPDSPAGLRSFLHDKREYFPLSASFERPPGVAMQDERKDLGQLDRATFVATVSAVKNFVPKDDARRGLEILELRDGLLYGGGMDLAFLCNAQSLAGVDLSVAREQLRALLRLLPSPTCQLARDRNFHIFSNSRTTLYMKITDLKHPADGPRLLDQQPEAGIIVDADMLRRRLEPLRKGRGAHCVNAFLHAKLVAGPPSALKMEGRRPSDGQQTVKGRDLLCQTDTPGLEFDLLTPLAGVEKALAGCEGRINLRAGQRHLYVSASVTNAPSVVRTVRLPAVQAVPPGRLAGQVRQLGRPASSPGRRHRAAT